MDKTEVPTQINILSESKIKDIPEKSITSVSQAAVESPCNINNHQQNVPDPSTELPHVNIVLPPDPGNHNDGNQSNNDEINEDNPNKIAAEDTTNNEKVSTVIDQEIVQSLSQLEEKSIISVSESQPRNTVMGDDTTEAAEQQETIVQSHPELECNVLEANVDNNISEIQQPLASSVLQTDTHPDPELGVQEPDDKIDEALSPSSQSLQTSGLTLLAAQYDSDSDDVLEVPSAQTYQNRCVEIDSDSSSDVEVLSEVRSPIDLDLLSAGHGEEDDEENIRNSRSPKVKGEFHLDDLPPIHELHITVPEEECTELGKIQSIIEQLVIVNSLPGTVPLDLDTVLFLDKGKQVLGEVFDVLGQVSDPLYCVRFNSNKDVKEKGIEVGQTVYVAPRTQHTQFIVLANLMKVRGSDASWENDIEPPEKHLDYSDDEEERTARRTVRNKNRPMDVDDEQSKRQRPSEASDPHCSVYPPQRSYRGNFHGPISRQPNYPPQSNYNIAGNSWHSNFYPNFTQPQQLHQPYHPPSGYRAPSRNISHRGPPPRPGLVFNPYAMFPPPQLMQQPLFPPPPQQPPPPPPGDF